MSKVIPNKPLLILLYGFPGAGKTYFARQLCEHLQAAHVQSDRIRYELFEQPHYDKQENEIIAHLMDYMTGELINAGVSVVYDTNVMRLGQRRIVRDMARKANAIPILLWLQIDIESAFARVAGRDRRRNDDKFAMPLDRSTFDEIASHMQNPERDEDYIVISGKHSFQAQLASIVKKLQDLGLVAPKNSSEAVVMPGLVNRVPNLAAGRVDNDRRNITIR